MILQLKDQYSGNLSIKVSTPYFLILFCIFYRFGDVDREMRHRQLTDHCLSRLKMKMR